MIHYLSSCLFPFPPVCYSLFLPLPHILITLHILFSPSLSLPLTPPPPPPPLSLSLSLFPLIGPIKQYGPPFDEYVSSNPSIEEMRDTVVSQFKRPTIAKGFTTSGVSPPFPLPPPLSLSLSLSLLVSHVCHTPNTVLSHVCMYQLFFSTQYHTYHCSPFPAVALECSLSTLAIGGKPVSPINTVCLTVYIQIGPAHTCRQC